MATTRRKSAPRSTSRRRQTITLSNMESFEDLKKIGARLWKKPVTKFIVGGAALGALVPIVMKVMKDYDIDTEVIKEKWDDLVSKGEETIDTTLNE